MDNIEQKTRELIERFMIDAMFFVTNARNKHKCAKQCAIICVEEIIASYKSKSPNYENETYWHPIDYWQQVKEKIQFLEINKTL